jgi:hypothetical protein
MRRRITKEGKIVGDKRFKCGKCGLKIPEKLYLKHIKSCKKK